MAKECKLECKKGYETFIKPPNPESPENQIWSQPVAYCRKSEHFPEPEEVESEEEEDILLTIHDFGYAPIRRREIQSAQAYFWYTDKKKKEGVESFVRNGGSRGIRHFNINTLAGKSEYEERSTMTYKFEQYPEQEPFEMLVNLHTKSGDYKSYFVGDPNEANVYCQDISDSYDDKGVCVSGNIKQLNRLEAKKYGFKPTGNFKQMKKSQGVPSDDIWVIVDGERKILTTREDEVSSNPRYVNVVPRSVLGQLQSETPYKIDYDGNEDGESCKITRQNGWRITVNCQSQSIATP